MKLSIINLEFNRENEIINFQCTERYSYVARNNDLILYEIFPETLGMNDLFKVTIANYWWYRNDLEAAIQSAQDHWKQLILRCVKIEDSDEAYDKNGICPITNSFCEEIAER